jgi:hypothetical protein
MRMSGKTVTEITKRVNDFINRREASIDKMNIDSDELKVVIYEE